MNIFYLDTNIRRCAAYHCDKHVVKMILESAQLLSTTVRLAGFDAGYKITHQNHPCAKWVRSSFDHYEYLFNLAEALNEEYKSRFNHRVNHKSFDVVCDLPVPVLPFNGWTEPPKCMPDEFKIGSTVESYREYYKKAKASFCTWKNGTPEWFI